MVLQSSIDSLKEKPHDEKKAVASGIAIGVVIILLVGWGFLFLRKIQKGAGTPTLSGTAVPQDQFDAQFLEQTQQQLNEMYQSASQDAQIIRDSAAQNQIDGTTRTSESVQVDSNVEGFGAGRIE